MVMYVYGTVSMYVCMYVCMYICAKLNSDDLISISNKCMYVSIYYVCMY